MTVGECNKYIEDVYEEVDNYSRQICFECNAPATGLPEKVLDWITNVFIDDYLDENEDRLPDKYDVLKGMCDYLQENCN